MRFTPPRRARRLIYRYQLRRIWSTDNGNNRIDWRQRYKSTREVSWSCCAASCLIARLKMTYFMSPLVTAWILSLRTFLLKASDVQRRKVWSGWIEVEVLDLSAACLLTCVFWKLCLFRGPFQDLPSRGHRMVGEMLVEELGAGWWKVLPLLSNYNNVNCFDPWGWSVCSAVTSVDRHLGWRWPGGWSVTPRPHAGSCA